MTLIRRRHRAALACALSLLLLFTPERISLTAPPGPGLLSFVQTSAPPASWALGIVVPQGAKLEGGGRVSWGSSGNLSAIASLPSFNSTDGTTLVILSAMIGSSSVLQVAVGLFPGDHTWREVGWYIPDIGAIPEVYEWTLNSTAVRIAPGSSVSLSIYQSAVGWNYAVKDLSSGKGISGRFESAGNLPFRSGDQEVFALESYSFNGTVFASMGSLILKSLTVDDQQVSGGYYYLTNWDPSHHPLFVVGGHSAPSFISLQDRGNGTVVWGYTEEWRTAGVSDSGAFYAAILLLAAGISVVTVIVALRVKPVQRSTGRLETTSALANTFMSSGRGEPLASCRGG